MAVDGRKLIETLRHGSDVFIENLCSPCAKDNRNVEAVKYCVDCEENICAKCVSDHKRFAVMRGHQIEDKPRAQPGRKRPDLPSKRCDKHGGKLIDVYCSGHNVVGCSTCIAVEHNACSDIKFIPDVSRGIRKSKEIQVVDDNMKDMKQRLTKLKQRKQGHLKHLRDEKDRIKTEIKAIRKKINEHIDKMEKIFLRDVDAVFDERINAVNNAIDMVNDMYVLMEKSQKHLQETMGENEAELFVHMKDASANINENANMLRDLETCGDKESIKWLPCPDIERILSHDSNIFGRVLGVAVPKSVRHVGDYNLRDKSDKETCNMLDICFTSSGNIFVTDRSNNCLKKLDQSYIVKARVKLPGSPNGLCEIVNTNIAVSLFDERKVQFVSQDTLRLSKSFSVGDRCRGICTRGNMLYVCCGGYVKDGEGPGHIEVYNTDGQKLQYIYGSLGQPYRICISRHSNELIVAHDINLAEKLLKINTNHHTMTEIKINKLIYPEGMVRIGEGWWCVTGYNSNNIVLVSEDGEMEEELLTKKDGIVKPVGVCFDEKRSKLIVSFDSSNVIKVFDLVM